MLLKSQGQNPESPTSKADILLGLSLGAAIVQFKESDPLLSRLIEQLLEAREAYATQWREHEVTKKIYRVITRRPLPAGAYVRIE